MKKLESLLVPLVKLVDGIPVPLSLARPLREHPKVFSDHLFLKALIIMQVRHRCRVHALLTMLAEKTLEMQKLC